MMCRHDPFEEAWIEAASRITGHGCALEIGGAFGRASIDALQRGCPHVVCNDLSSAHLAEVQRRHETLASGQGSLSTLAGGVPAVLDEWLPPTPLRAILAANILHFLSPEDVRRTFTRLHNLCSDGAEFFVSVDAPWNGGFRPFWPLYTARRMLGDAHPGYTTFPGPMRHALPARLRAVKVYHPMEPQQLAALLDESGWEVVSARHFAGDAAGNPEGVSVGNGVEMSGAHAIRRGGERRL